MSVRPIARPHAIGAALAILVAAPSAFAQTRMEEVPAEETAPADEQAADDRASAADEAARRAAKQRRLSRLHDPRGTVLLGVSGGASFSSNFNYGIVGAHVGYAALTGVMPGVRGAVFFGDLTGGEFAGMLWLTPPLALPVVPFAVGEIGYASQSPPDADGMLFGAGAGLHLGEPQARFNMRAGFIYRYYDLGGGFDTWNPILMLSLRF
jgi:hypothetical protein